MKRSAQPLHGGSPAKAGLSSITSHAIAPWKWPDVGLRSPVVSQRAG
jgi:hypothetical protein